MIGRTLKKLFGKSDQKENAGAKFAIKLRQKSEKFSNFLGEKFHAVRDEFFNIRSKCENLRETNYALGLKHLEKGDLSDAIFRFRFIKKFWPDLFDAYYQLSYCLVLEQKLVEAKTNLEELLTKNPHYDSKAKELLGHINDALKQQSPNA